MNKEKGQKGYLLESIVKEWSPLKEGQVAKEKDVQEFIALLNQNPDRYVSATR